MPAIRNIQASLETNPNPHVAAALDAITDDLWLRFSNDPNGCCAEIERAFYAESSKLKSKEEAFYITLELIIRRVETLESKTDLSSKEAQMLSAIQGSPLYVELSNIYQAKADDTRV